MSSNKENEKEVREKIDNTLDITKSSVNKSTNEAMKQVPEFTKAVNEYQKETIQASKDIADNFLDSQKEVIDSFQSASERHIENMPNWYWANRMSPSVAAEWYAITVRNIVDSAIAMTNLANDAMFASMNAWKIMFQQTRDNMLQFSRLNANFARTFEDTAKKNSNGTQNRETQ
jgi:hypothetical protein